MRRGTLITVNVMAFPMSKARDPNGPNAVGHKNILSAVTTALMDLVGNEGQLPPVPPEVRIEGKVCLVTGAGSGLGKAVSVELARRGGRVIMVCRGGIPEAGEEVKQLSGNTQIEMLHADLSDLESVSRLCDQLRDSGTVIDIAVLNAGLMPLNARRSPQGYELMFAVHFLANRLMLARWLHDGVIRPGGKNGSPPRVIFVSSEAHKSSTPIDFNKFAAFTPYGMNDGMKYYASSKLHLSTFAVELSRRENTGDLVEVAVHSLCPGPIASNIARESPAWVKPLLGPIMRWFFRSPQQAAEPVVYLACAPEMGERTGVYLHMMREKQPSSLALDAENGKRLWQMSGALLEPFLPNNREKSNASL